jgi:hydroxyacylglutathione hydrolase
MIDVLPIKALSDNYIWCLMNTANRCCVIVDPGEADPVLEMLRTHQLKLTGILITHHHWDHTQGIAKIVAEFNVPVYGPAREAVDGVTDHLQDGNQIRLDDLDLTLHVSHIPGHTLGHIAYHGHDLLFSGDTLFTGGCGRIFEGTVEQMYSSLTTLAALKQTTLIYCGHEYTAANLKFAQLVEPNNPDIQLRIQEVTKLRAQDLPTVPGPLSIEKLTNPFLRCNQQDVIKAAETYSGKTLATPEEVLGIIREWKNCL